MTKAKMGQDILRDFAAQVRSLREAHGMTREELAERSGISSQNIAKIENADRFITVESLGKLCNAFGCSPEDLFKLRSKSETNTDATAKLTRLLKNKSEKELKLAHDLLSRIFRDL